MRRRSLRTSFDLDGSAVSRAISRDSRRRQNVPRLALRRGRVAAQACARRAAEVPALGPRRTRTPGGRGPRSRRRSSALAIRAPAKKLGFDRALGARRSVRENERCFARRNEQEIVPRRVRARSCRVIGHPSGESAIGLTEWRISAPAHRSDPARASSLRFGADAQPTRPRIAQRTQGQKCRVPRQRHAMRAIEIRSAIKLGSFIRSSLSLSAGLRFERLR